MSPDPACKRRFLLPLGIALLGLGINTIVAACMATTIDEPAHVSYGGAILRGNPDRSVSWFDSKMPVSALNGLPRGIGIYLQQHGMAPGLSRMLRDFRVTRYATIAAAFCLCLLVFVYAESLFNRKAALFAELLFVMNPNIIAHSTLSTTDLYAAAGYVLFLYCLRRFLLAPTSSNTLLTASALAAAQLTKFTAVYLYFVLALALAASLLYQHFGRESRLKLSWRQVGVLLALTAGCSLIAINAGFLFDRTFTPLSRYAFKSETFRALQRIPGLRDLPLPLPYAYLQGFDMMSLHNATGAGFANIVLLGEVRGPQLSRRDGFPSYYLVAYLLKEPLGMQLLLALGLLWIFRNRSPADLLAGEGLLLVAAASVIVPLSFFSATQIGIRHILPALVIFTILAGGAFQAWDTYSQKRKFLLALCVAYVAVSVASYFPHMIPYFNEFLTDRKLAYKFLVDSNLDWGQDAWVVDCFLKANPDVVLDPPSRVPGRVLVGAQRAAGVIPRNADYFVRVEGLQPIAHVGYGHLLFLVPASPPISH